MFGAPTCSFKSECQGKTQIRPIFVGILDTDPSLKTPSLALDWDQESSEAVRMCQKGVE